MITGINFPQETLSRLQAEADRTGKDFDTIVTEAVEAKIAVSQSSLQEVVRPIAEAIIASGMTPEEGEAFFDQETSCAASRATRFRAKTMTTAVFDCIVFLQAAANPNGAAGACLALVESGKVEIILSAAIIAEARAVLTRPKTRARFPQLTEDKVERFLLKIADLARIVHEVPPVIAHHRDPTDEPYINLAIAARANFIVTRDNDLLYLMNDVEFRNSYPSLTVVDPVAFLNLVRTE